MARLFGLGSARRLGCVAPWRLHVPHPHIEYGRPSARFTHLEDVAGFAARYNAGMCSWDGIRNFFAGGGACRPGAPWRSYQTLSGPARVYEMVYDDGKPVRVVRVRGAFQSASYLDGECYELVFAYHRVYNAMFDVADAAHQIRHVAMLGGGGFSYPKYLIAHYPNIFVDVAEIDPMMISLARRWFYLDRLELEFDTEKDGRLRIFADDARHFLEETPQRYDAILNDCFTARMPVMSLATLEAARTISARLNEGGLYLTNVISALRGEKAALLHAVMRTLGEVFAHVHVLPGSEGLPRLVDNYVVVASDRALDFPHAIKVEPTTGEGVLRDAFLERYEREFHLADV